MKYAIFDLDGTVVDSMKYWRNFGRYYLIEKGYNPGENELERIESVNWAKGICDYFYEHYHFILTPEELYTWGMDFMKRKYSNDIKFKPGAVELLEKLHNSGVKMCICSSTDYRLMEPALERLDIAKYFDFTVHCREYGKEKTTRKFFCTVWKGLEQKIRGKLRFLRMPIIHGAPQNQPGFMWWVCLTKQKKTKIKCRQFPTNM